jgi:hypothetical protein
VAHIRIDDAFGFYQSPFIDVSEILVTQGYITQEQHDLIVRYKNERSNFDKVPLKEIKPYCHHELVALSKALTVLRDGFDEMGITQKSWPWAGAVAAALIRKE